MSADNRNPSDIHGPLQYGTLKVCVVTDIDDPLKVGRFQLLDVGKQTEQTTPQNKQPWVSCVSSKGAQHRGVGVFPPQEFVTGTRVLVADLGNQNSIILGALPNTEDKEKRHQDMNRAAQGPGNTPLILLLAGAINAIFAAFGSKYPYNYKGTKDALGFLLRKLGANWKTGDANQSVLNNSKTPDYLGSGFGSKIFKKGGGPFGIGPFPFNSGDMTDPVKYIQSKIGTKGEIIPNALQMSQTLKQIGLKGLNIDSLSSVGGLGNITGALSGISSLISSKSKANTDKEEAEDLEAQLRQLYRELFEKEPLNSQGLETEDYKKWKAEYLSNVDLTPYEESTGATS